MFLLFLCLPLLSLIAGEYYQFRGRHYLASYLDCDEEAISNVSAFLDTMDRAVAASHATILSRNHYVFDPAGLTVVYLLSESHASLHTYPEKRACFVDLFTCGDSCSSDEFNRTLQDYLRPEKTVFKHFYRYEEIEEVP